MLDWYNIVNKCVNIWGFLAIMVISITIIVYKALSIKRDKQFLDVVSKKSFDYIHMSITEDKTQYELDLK